MRVVPADWLAELGVPLPGPGQLVEAGFALVLAILALGAGWLIRKRLGNAITAFAGKHVAGGVEGIKPRICAMIQHGSAAILLALLLNAYRWQPPAEIGIGFALGCATALTALAALRALGLPRWAAWAMAMLAFASIFTNAVGGIKSLQDILASVGFDIGSRRVSLLSVTTIAVTVVALYALVRLANRILAHLIGEASAFDPTQKLLAQKLAAIAIVIVAFFFGIDLLGIDLTSFAVFSGAMGLAIGFGLQKTVGNLIAGIILLMDRSIKPGDVIVVGDSFGWVNKIGVRAVSVITRDGKEHLIPNENLMTQEVENWSYTDRNVRVRIPVGVAYDCDLKLAQELMMRAVKESPRVLDNPKPNVWLTEFGENAVRHEILVWISDPESGVGNVKSDVLNRLWLLFREHGIKVPLPQRVITVQSASPAGDVPTSPA